MLLDQFLFELSCKNPHRNTHTHIDAHKDSDEYFIVSFCKNATIILKHYDVYNNIYLIPTLPIHRTEAYHRIVWDIYTRKQPLLHGCIHP